MLGFTMLRTMLQPSFGRKNAIGLQPCGQHLTCGCSETLRLSRQAGVQSHASVEPRAWGSGACLLESARVTEALVSLLSWVGNAGLLGSPGRQ